MSRSSLLVLFWVPFTCSEAFCSVGYSPHLIFNVPDLQDSLTRLLKLGAQMDGAVQYTLQGHKVVCCLKLKAYLTQLNACIFVMKTHSCEDVSALLQVASVRSPEGQMIGLVEGFSP